MAPRKRTQSARKLLGAQNSETRAAVIGAVEQIMREEGYAAVTSRKIAGKLGLKHQVVFYYFDTLDDLLIEVFRRGGEEGLRRVAATADAEDPLRALWKVMSDPSGTRWIMEFMALANHNQAIRAEIHRYANEWRKLQAEVLARHLHARGANPRVSPLLASVLMSALARLLGNEASVDIDLGHAEAEALVESYLRQLEAPEAAAAGEGRGASAPAVAGA